MPIFELASDTILPLHMTTFSQLQLQERRDLQRLLRANISVISPSTLIIAEEFVEWDDSSRRIDLLGIDRDANLVVIELKRTEDGGHMELQAIRYAAMVSQMTFQQATGVFERYLLKTRGEGPDARAELLDFLGWIEPDEKRFGQDVRIVLASAEFSRELTTSALWLRDHDIDIRCVRLQPYSLGERVLVDVQQIIPLPEIAEYQVRVSEKKREEREDRLDGRDWTSYDLTLGDSLYIGLRKRHAIYRTFRYLVENGIKPEEVAKNCGPRANRVLMSIEGEVSPEDFIARAKTVRERDGRNFDPKRFFCDEGEIVHFDGRSYAFSSQWGGTDWLDAMKNLSTAFEQLPVKFDRSA